METINGLEPRRDSLQIVATNYVKSIKFRRDILLLFPYDVLAIANHKFLILHLIKFLRIFKLFEHFNKYFIGYYSKMFCTYLETDILPRVR